MKTPVIAVYLCLILMASLGFAQISTSSATMQMRGSSMMMNPDGKSFNGTATFGPPTFPIMVIPGAPFSAEEIGSQTQILPDGNRITHAMPSVFLFRDSAGRTRTERPLMMMAPNSNLAVKLPLIPEIYDPVAGSQYFLGYGQPGGASLHITPSTACSFVRYHEGHQRGPVRVNPQGKFPHS